MVRYFQKRKIKHIFPTTSPLYYYNVLTIFSERYKLPNQDFKLTNRSFRTIYCNYSLHKHSYKNGKFCPDVQKIEIYALQMGHCLKTHKTHYIKYF